MKTVEKVFWVIVIVGSVCVALCACGVTDHEVTVGDLWTDSVQEYCSTQMMCKGADEESCAKPLLNVCNLGLKCNDPATQALQDQVRRCIAQREGLVCSVVQNEEPCGL